MDIIIGIGEIGISNSIEDVIITYALVSCVGLTIYSPKNHTAGMAHIALPKPVTINKSNRIGYYATTAVPEIINRMCYQYGCNKRDMIVSLYGGAISQNKNDIFNIGKRNVETVKRILKDMGIKINFLDIGGTNSRTLKMNVATGRITVSLQPMINHV